MPHIDYPPPASIESLITESTSHDSISHPNGFSVGIFDSGVGGLSVLRHIRQLLPLESLIYFADAGFAPYGDKTDAEILQRCLFAADLLCAQQIKAMVIACNTATAAAVAALRIRHPELIIIGMEPGLKPATVLSRSKIIGVLATKSTLQSQKFLQLRGTLEQEGAVQFSTQACVGLVELIEKAQLSTPETTQMIRHYVVPLLEQGADTLVLGCTHYPFVADAIRKVADEFTAQSANLANSKVVSHQIHLIDTGAAVARRLHQLLEQKQLLAVEQNIEQIQAFTTGNETVLSHAFEHMLGLYQNAFKITKLL